LHGDGNAMSGVIGCSGLDLVDYRLTQDAGSTGIPSAPQLTFSGSGGPGSAVIFGTTAIGTILGACTGCEPGYGPDCEFCTADDPPSSVGVPTTAPFTTGTATAEVLNANATSGLSIGPFSVVGSPLDCVSLLNGGSSGGTIVAVATTLGLPTLGDIALTAQIAFQPGALNTPTPTPIPPLCIGDCNRDGTVTVDELITGVNMALGRISPRSCDAFCVPGCTGGPGLGLVTVDCVIRGVNNAIDGCLARCVTDQDCNAGNPCLLYECTASGCQYACGCV